MDRQAIKTWLLLAGLFFKMGELHLTKLILLRGGVELNPLMNSLITSLGMDEALMLNYLVVIGLSLVVYKWGSIRLLGLVAAIQGIIFIHNALMIIIGGI